MGASNIRAQIYAKVILPLGEKHEQDLGGNQAYAHAKDPALVGVVGGRHGRKVVGGAEAIKQLPAITDIRII